MQSYLNEYAFACTQRSDPAPMFKILLGSVRRLANVQACRRGGFCVFHSGKLDLAELGRRGGKARGRKRGRQVGDRRVELAWAALEELLASDTPATAKVRASSELLDRLEPLLGPVSKSAAVKQARQELADEYAAATESVRAKLESMLATRAAGMRAPGGKPAWMDEVAAAPRELDRVIVDTSGAEPIVRQLEVDPCPIIAGLVERGPLGYPAEWQRFQAHVDERLRELTADAEARTAEAERRALEAEARLAEFTAGPPLDA